MKKRVRCLYVMPLADNDKALQLDLQEALCRTFARKEGWRVRNESYASALDKIEGIGPKRRADLLKNFKSIKAIKNASIEQLSLVVPTKTAKAVYDYFHTGEEK